MAELKGDLSYYGDCSVSRRVLDYGRRLGELEEGNPQSGSILKQCPFSLILGTYSKGKIKVNSPILQTNSEGLGISPSLFWDMSSKSCQKAPEPGILDTPGSLMRNPC